MNQLSPMPLGVTAVMLPELDLPEQLALCREIGVTHYTLRPRVIRDDQRDQPYSNWGNHRFDLTPRRLVDEGKAIRSQLDDAGITPFGTVPNATTDLPDDELKLHLEGAAVVGAGRVRINPAPYPTHHFDYRDYARQLVDRYHQIVGWSKPMGLKLVMETHSRTSVSGPGLALNICQHFDPSEVGVIFDLPNFAGEGNLQPVLAVAVLADYIDHTHIGGGRRVTRGYDEIAFRQTDTQSCPMTESDLHIPTWLRCLRGADVHRPLVIEDYTRGIPGKLRLQMAVRELTRALEAL